MSKAKKIMIIRHAEKPPKNPPPNGVDIDGKKESDSLIPQGWQRAGALVVLFAPSRGKLQDSELATPDYIFASAIANKGKGKDEANRPEETITPLLAKLNLIGNFDYPKSKGADLAKAAMNCDGIVLISWPHGQIPALANQIPLSPNNKHTIPQKWPGTRFDIVFVFDLDVHSRKGGYIFHQVPQLLLAGDSPEIIK
jgi:hypothetical protein